MKKIFLVVLTLALGFASCDKEGDFITRQQAKFAVGSSANDLLSDAKYTQLIVEVQYMVGQKPTDAAIANLSEFLNERLRKPSGISIVYTTIPAQGKSVYTIEDIVEIEENNRTQYNDGATIAAYFLFVDGDLSPGDGVTLGVAYRNTSMCIFEPNITSNSGGLLGPSQAVLETTVLTHEFGHILGLVDLGSDMQVNHIDEAHGKHCDNENCLMYYTANTTDVIGNLSGGAPSLDANCLADLRANGGN